MCSNLMTNDGTILENMDVFKYLGSLTDSSEKDIGMRKSLTWKTNKSYVQDLEINEHRAKRMSL